jgi:hypothetical protein
MTGAKISSFGKTKTVAIAILIAITSVPAFAQIDFSGTWASRNYGDALSNQPGPEPTPVDYLGIPFNEYGLARALSYSYSQFSMPDRACAFYPSPYLLIGPFGMKIWNETEPRNGSTIAWKIGGWEDLAPITIWMDGRPHPSKNALHSMSGFTTGTWEGDVLTTYTTHMNAGILRRNGAPHSDQATMTTRFFRHGDIMTVTARIDDPMYLTQPYYLTRTFQLSSVPSSRSVGQPCTQVNEGVPEGAVPHYFPGKNPFLDEMTKVYNIPAEAVLGGVETMYPDYRKKLKDKYVVPERCLRACGGPGLFPLRAN